MKKSNLFAYVEMQKMVSNLQRGNRCLRERLVAQAAYLLILEPKYFSDELATEWRWLRCRMGYPERGRLRGAAALKTTVQCQLQALSDLECQTLYFALREMFARLSAEFEG